MNLQGVDRNELVKVVTKLVVEKLGGEVELDPDRQIKIGVSNHHVHLDRPTMDALFGAGSELHPMKLLGQPGQYASAETVTVTGPRGSLKRLRILGPLRAKTQVESLPPTPARLASTRLCARVVTTREPRAARSGP